MIVDYDKSFALFTNYINRQIASVKNKMNNVEYNDRIKKIYNEIKNRRFSSFIKYYEVLSKVSSSIKDNLDIIDFLVKNNIVTVPQMDDAIDNILKDDQLLRIISNNDKKEPLQEELEILEGILSGKYNFEDFKRILLSSDLDNESIISILTHEAESSINVVKKQLPSLDSFQKDNELVSRYDEVMDKINKIIDKYYSLLENKPANLIEMYKNTMLSSNMLEINDVFKEKDVLVCMHISHLIDLKSEGERIVNTKPIDNEVFEIFIEDLEIACEKAMDAIIEYEKEQIESIPRESTLYFLLNDDKGFFNLDEMSAEEKKNIDAILSDLETGLFDYERKRNGHTIVKQSIRRDLNVFVNRKRNTCVSFIRINKKGFKDSKVLVLGVDDFRSIFDTSKSILKTNSSLIDESVEKIIVQDEEFERKEQEFKDSLNDMLSKEEVKSK